MSYDTGFESRCDCGAWYPSHEERAWGRCQKCRVSDSDLLELEQTEINITWNGKLWYPLGI